ncbi:alanine--glyoxylate aminotransferase family protein [Anoxybacterium hadale]|uniref:Alanine--glyoxylate aminotransferase family protein n=1 Tax=Anoxybacterium hadale TaxID=3408580 RepID=A0ACD1A8L6_9FIRM|nr:alanine--glyoxylate aminotransferase family protein [Clostridiales bacterium]
MKTPLIMTPGPTSVHEDVRRAMSKKITNPDLDMEFYEFYKETSDRLKQLFLTSNDILILNGEGILGLEAACASLIEPGDQVLCLDNGIFGKGFGEFAELYGAEVTYFKSDYRKAISVEELEQFLADRHDFKLALLVHCETPSGITNPVNHICPLLKKYGILTVVDSVSAVGGEELRTDEWQMDLVLAGSQKCLSAPPGLSIVSISGDAWKMIQSRKQPVAGFYCNLSLWSSWYEKKWFPYTQPVSDLYGLRAAVDRILTEGDSITRHKKYAEAVRTSLVDAGLELYAQDGFSNTVTTVLVPDGIRFQELFNAMLTNHNIMIAGAFDYLADKVFRIGHMGENCREETLYLALKALNEVLKKHRVVLEKELHIEFVNLISQM